MYFIVLAISIYIIYIILFFVEWNMASQFYDSKKGIWISILVNIILTTNIYYYDNKNEYAILEHKLLFLAIPSYFIITIFFLYHFQREGLRRYNPNSPRDFLNLLPLYTWMYYRQKLGWETHMFHIDTPWLNTLLFNKIRRIWIIVILITPLQFYGFYYFVAQAIGLVSANSVNFAIAIISSIISFALTLLFKYLINLYAPQAIKNHNNKGSQSSTTHVWRNKGASTGGYNASIADVYNAIHGSGAFGEKIYYHLFNLRIFSIVFASLLPLTIAYFLDYYDLGKSLKRVLLFALISLIVSIATSIIAKKQGYKNHEDDVMDYLRRKGR